MAMISPLSLESRSTLAPAAALFHSLGDQTRLAIVRRLPVWRCRSGRLYCGEGQSPHESPHAALIKVHLAEQNRSEALRGFKRYHDLRAELDIGPSTELRRVLDPPPDDVTPR
jgi:hypothetical protein